MPKGLIGRKLGMTQVFTENGELLPVTVIEVTPNVVVQKEDHSYRWIRSRSARIWREAGVVNQQAAERAFAEGRCEVCSSPAGVPG